jgi:hypothetical protein
VKTYFETKLKYVLINIIILEGNVNKMCNIIEKELVRKSLYEHILHEISDKLDLYLQQKEIQHFLLRYIFNKIIERKDDEDPIFIFKLSEICRLQVVKDFEFKQIDEYHTYIHT